MNQILTDIAEKLCRHDSLSQTEIQHLLHSDYLCDGWRERDDENYRTNFIIKVDDDYYQISPTWDTAGKPIERAVYNQPIKVNRVTIPRVIETIRYVPENAMALDTGALITPDYFENLLDYYLDDYDAEESEKDEIHDFIMTEAPKALPRKLMLAIRDDDYIWDQLSQLIDSVALDFIRNTIQKGA